MNEKRQILVLGAGYAGLMAAMRLKKRLGPIVVGVTVIDSRAMFQERVRLHQLVLGQDVPRRPFVEILAPAGINFIQGQVEAVDRAARCVNVSTASGLQTLAYERLIYALGSHTRSDVPGVGEHAFRLDHKDVGTLKERLSAIVSRQGRVTVVGAGGTGLEMAAELAEQHPSLAVSLVSQGEIGDFLSTKGAAYARNVFTRLGVELIPNVAVTAVKAGVVHLSTGQQLPHDLCIWTGGFAVSPLAVEAGLAVNQTGQIQVNRQLRSVNDRYVYAAGDAAMPVANVGAPVRMALYTALFMGAYVADAVAGDVKGRSVNPFSFSYIAMGISLGRQQGLVQFLSGSEDRPVEFILRGKPAIWFKEFFTHFGLWAIRLQRRAPWAFYWLGKGKWRRLSLGSVRRSELVEG